MTLSGSNTYTGGTTISNGTLRAGSARGFSSGSAFIVNSFLDLGGRIEQHVRIRRQRPAGLGRVLESDRFLGWQRYSD